MIVGILGLAGSGKSSVSEILKNEYNFVHMSFADSLKDAISVIFGWDREMLSGRTEEARATREKIDTWWSQRLRINGLTPRWVLQQWGTEVGRMSFHSDIWVASLQRKLLDTTVDVVIDDCRFENEIVALKDVGATIIKVVRDPQPEWHETALRVLNGFSPYLPPENNEMTRQYPSIHISEWGWANQKVDYIIDNNSDLEHLHTKISTIITEIKK